MGIEIGVIIGLVIGAVVSFFVVRAISSKSSANKIEEINRKVDLEIKEARLTAQRLIDEAETKAEKIVGKAEGKHERIKQEKIQEAKEHWAKRKAEFESERASHVVAMKEREMEVVNQEKELQQKIKDFKSKVEAVENKEAEIKAVRENLEVQLKIVAKKKEELDQANEERIKELENISRLTETQAREQLLEAIRAKASTEAMAIEKEAVQHAQANASKEAKKIIVQSIQRMCAEVTIENAVSVFSIESDDIKGQIIGREGRNIRALEAATGAEIVVDDTPEAIIISSFDPVRREVARLALKRLVADGRIHPARIEEVVAKIKKQLDEQIVEIGERTVIDLDIHGLDPYLVKMIGRMRFRSSYGQNLLQHSREVANLCAIMAAELGLNVKQAKRAGLLHDIGKVWPEELEKPHAIAGMELAQKYKEHPVVCNAIGAHHDEIEMTSPISPIVQACDALSGARPGARREVMEQYIKRLRELEELATSFEGVEKCYAIQAGRELRVILDAEKVTDERASQLSFDISQKIERDMQYPGQIKVTVIREMRSVAYAK